MSQNAPLPLKAEPASSFTACKNCHSPMPRELRFCRNCGFRLGEGPAEYTETVRFPSGHQAVVPGARSTAEQKPYVTTYGLSGGPITASRPRALKACGKRMS